MKKLIIITIVILLWLGFDVFNNKTYADSEETQNIIEDEINLVTSIDKYSVRIFSIGYSGLSHCTGSVLSNNENYSTVLTCKHCLNVDKEFFVEQNKVLKIITVTGKDLAYLIVKGKINNKEAIHLAENNSPIGTKIKIYGMPGLTTIHQKRGEIIFYTKDWGFAKLDVIGGCSGAGIFNQNNELVGVVWGKYTEGGIGGGLFSEPTGGISIALFEPLINIIEFLDKIKQ